MKIKGVISHYFFGKLECCNVVCKGGAVTKSEDICSVMRNNIFT